MKMLYIKISLCFTYLLQKCMPTNHLNAYNNAPMGFPQRGRAQQACSVVLTTSFVDRQNGLCAIFFTARSPDLHSCTAFFLNKGKIIKDTHSNYPVCLCFAKWYNPTSNYSILKTLYDLKVTL